ncbi:MAG: hypothetical protein RBU37_10450 [Myxococcota bacterium]|nr:hypothetical protein [Myxococcota bacterium]
MLRPHGGCKLGRRPPQRDTDRPTVDQALHHLRSVDGAELVFVTP